MTFMDTSEGIKNRPSRYGINLLLFKLNNILKLCPLQTLQNVYIEECTYWRPTVFEWVGAEQTIFFHMKQILQTWIWQPGLG